MMEPPMSRNDYRQQNPEDGDELLKCDICEQVHDEVLEVGSLISPKDAPEALCDTCAESLNLELCERCGTWSDNFTSSEQCFNCFESDVAAAESYYEGDR